MANWNDFLHNVYGDELSELTAYRAVNGEIIVWEEENKRKKFSDSAELFEYLSKDIYGNTHFHDMLENFREDVLANVEIPFCQVLRENSLTDLDPKVWDLFMYAVCETLANGTNVLTLQDYTRAEIKVLEDMRIFREATTYEQREETLTEIKGYLFTPVWHRKLFADAPKVEKDTLLRKYSNCVNCEEIRPMDLFYPPLTADSVSRLTLMLMPDKFDEICKTLSAENFSTGILGVLYGAPGSGKTEAVYQIARRTGRDLYMVSPSDIQATYMGESEKRVTDLFNCYEYCSCIMDKQPILLFNEADGIFTKRLENPASSAAVSINAVQTIILQFLEKTKGIVLMTTNILSNMDVALFRRITVKIDMPVPDAEIRAKIWAKKIPAMPKEWLSEISEAFPFTGGNISNVAKNVLIDECLDKGSFTLAHIKEICEMERVERQEPPRKRIGF